MSGLFGAQAFTSMDLQGVRNEMQQLSGLFGSQAFTSMTPQEQSNTRQGMVNNVVNHIQALSDLSLPAANSLRTLIEVPAFTLEQQGQLMQAAIATAMRGRASATGPTASTQTLANPLEYCSGEDWSYADTATSLSQVEVHFCSRWAKLGLKHPSEKNN